MARTRTLRAVTPPLTLGDDYRRALLSLIREMRDETEERIFEAYQTALSTEAVQDAPNGLKTWIRDIIGSLAQNWQSRFDSLADQLAGNIMGRISGSNRRKWLTELKRAGLAVEFQTTSQERRLLRDLIRENVRLIKSIPSQHHRKVRQLVEGSLDRGRDITGLRGDLRQRFQITERRAQTIARTETNKAFEALSIQRMKDVGVRFARWLHRSGSKEPRPTHKGIMNGKIFPLSEGLFDPALGRKIFPGQEYNCRCSFRVVLDPDIVAQDNVITFDSGKKRKIKVFNQLRWAA